MKLDPRHLAQLAAIVETGSFHAAAELLGLSQPALSRNIKTLESRLGAAVLDRSERKVKVTELGRRLARNGMIIRSAELAASSYADQTYMGEAGTLLIGAPPTLASYLLAPLFAGFLSDYVEVSAELRVGLVHELRALLIQGSINAVIGPISLAAQSDDLKVDDLIDDRVGILCRAGHPLTEKDHVTAAVLESQRWAAHSRGSYLRYQTDNALAAFGLREVNIAIETDSVEVAFDIVRRSDIVTTMPKLPSQSQLSDGTLVFLEIDNPLFSRPIGYIQRRSQELSRAEERFKAFVQTEIRRLM